METKNMHFTFFLISLIMSTFTIVVIVLIRKLFQKQLSAKWQYNLWFLLLISLTLPFIPKQLILFKNDIIPWGVKHNSGLTTPSVTNADNLSGRENWMQDFTLTVNRYDPEVVNSILTVIWIAGMFVLVALTIQALLKIKRIKKTVFSVQNREVLHLFAECKKHLHISNHVIVGESPLVNTPMTFGISKTYIVLPANFYDWFSKEEMKHIFLHELNHYKHKDILTNYLTICYQIVYWFNPFVWFAFRQMRLDREIACDIAVLNALGENNNKQYGYTLLKSVEKASHHNNFLLTNQLNGSKDQMKKRMEKIASHTKEPTLKKLKSMIIFTVASIFVISQLPLLSVMADSNSRFDFSSQNIVTEDLSVYFNSYEGSFVLYNLQADQYRIYNEKRSTWRVSPNSTYKIYSGLFALESNIITHENSTIKWNGVNYQYDSWNKDQNLSTALAKSVTWYFQELDRRTQEEDIQRYLNELNYGNIDISGGIENYWLESSLRISPVEQVQLLKSLYRNEYGFNEKHVRTVTNALFLEENEGARLSGKTGTGNVNGENTNGWFIGYVETEDNTYFFATYIQGDHNTSGSKAAELTLSILRDKGLY